MTDNYLENFNPNALDEEKEDQKIPKAIKKQKDKKTHIDVQKGSHLQLKSWSPISLLN